MYYKDHLSPFIAFSMINCEQLFLISDNSCHSWAKNAITPVFLQLDWMSCADTHKINLSRDQEGYNRFEYTDEKLLARRIQLCLGHFSSIFKNNSPKKEDIKF